MAVIFCETSNPTKWVIDQPPTVRTPGQHRPDRGTIGGSRTDRDYRMSTYDKASPRAAQKSARRFLIRSVSLIASPPNYQDVRYSSASTVALRSPNVTDDTKTTKHGRHRKRSPGRIGGSF